MYKIYKRFVSNQSHQFCQPSFEETEEILKHLPNGKVPGQDGKETKLLKYESYYFNDLRFNYSRY